MVSSLSVLLLSAELGRGLSSGVALPPKQGDYENTGQQCLLDWEVVI